MTIIHVTDSEGEQHEVEAQVGLPIMESLRDLDNGTLALCGGMCSCATLPLLFRRTLGIFSVTHEGR